MEYLILNEKLNDRMICPLSGSNECTCDAGGRYITGCDIICNVKTGCSGKGACFSKLCSPRMDPYSLV